MIRHATDRAGRQPMRRAASRASCLLVVAVAAAFTGTATASDIPPVACCLPSGQCEVVDTESTCTGMGGMVAGGTSCDTVDCPPP
ncbi:MAG: hypothetical protein ACYTJ0_05640, partial [Planctomycetota bacterium]